MPEVLENDARHWGSSFMDPRGKNRSEVGDLFGTVLTMVLDHLASASQKSASPKVESYSGFTTIPDQPQNQQLPTTRWKRCSNYLAEKAEVCLTSPVYREEMWLKAVILNPYTGASDLKRLADAYAEHSLHNRVSTVEPGREAKCEAK